MGSQQLLFDEPSNRQQPTLSKLVSYFKHLSDSKNDNIAEHGSSLLLDAHSNKSSLFLEKYLPCAIPNIQLEFIFESQGFSDYSACLNPGKEFKHRICTHDDGLNELFIPNIVGDSLNPYIRFKSSSVSGSQQCKKLINLAGIDIKDIDYQHDNVINSLVLSYPQEISLLLLDERYRSRAVHGVTKTGKRSYKRSISSFNLIDRMNRCYTSFFVKIRDLFPVLMDDDILGSSVSLHTWSSEFPFMPHCHHHVILPHFTYRKNRYRISELLEETISKYADSVQTISVGTVKHTSSKHLGSIGGKVTFNEDVELKHRYIVDKEQYARLKRELSKELSWMLGFKALPWQGVKYPFDVKDLRSIWSDCVFEEFSDILKQKVNCDIHTQFINCNNKSKLLHSLQYKTRPAVLDLNLFFDKVPDFVTGYNELNPAAVMDHIRSCFVKAVMSENISLSKKYESILSKTEHIFSSSSEEEVYSWLQFISTWKTDTRVYGFWRNIKRYLLDPDNNILVEEDICPVCGGSISTINSVNYCVFDNIILRSGSKFFIYDMDGLGNG